MLQKIKHVIKRLLSFLLNPRLLLCFWLGWMITNGWCYLFLAFGAYFNIGWMAAMGGAYAAFLWFPFTPEKIVTVAIAIFLLRLLFPHDQATLAVLQTEARKAKEAFSHMGERRRLKQFARKMRRVILIDCQDSRKSTFARALHDRTGIPLIDLDVALDEDLQQERWIASSHHLPTVEACLAAADAVILLGDRAERRQEALAMLGLYPKKRTVILCTQQQENGLLAVLKPRRHL